MVEQHGAISHQSDAVGTEGDGTTVLGRAIAANYDRLAPSQRRVIDHMLADARYAAMASITELARDMNVNVSTVTRAAQGLGFAGYPDLQARLRERFVKPELERVRASAMELRDVPVEVARRVMREDAEQIHATADDLLGTELDAVVERVLSARRTYVCGSWGSHGLAVMLGVGLGTLLPDIRIIDIQGRDFIPQLLDLGPDDAIIVISFRRIEGLVVRIMEYAVTTKATTIAITDHLASPIARLATHSLIVQLGTLRVLPSYAAGASLVNAILTVVSLRVYEEAAPRLRRMDELRAHLGFSTEE